MKHVLIITEDIIKIQTLSGFLGRLFRSFYTSWLKFRLQSIILLLKYFFQVSVITSDAFKLDNIRVYHYGIELSKQDYSANRRRNLSITSRLLKNFPHNLFKNRLAIHLTYDYFIYAQTLECLIKKINPDLVVTLSGSYHEQIAHYLVRELKIKYLKFHWFTFIWLNHWLKYFFLKRQYQKKINQFMVQSQIPVPSLEKLRSASIFSLDFYRHLKTLTPIYRVFKYQGLNPWFVTDITNIRPVLKNLGIDSANHFFLASFLPKNFTALPVNLPKKINSINNLDDLLFNLGLSESWPMINLSHKLSELYLAASKNLFNLIKPKGVVVVSDARFCELALAAVAKTTKTKSLLVSPNTLLALDQINAYDTTDKVAVVGQHIKQQLLNLGLNQDKITVVGDPQTENYRQLTVSLDPKKVFATLGLSAKQKIILLISFGPSQMIPKPEKEAFVKLAAQAVKACENAVLVIKPHPSEKRYRVLEELKLWGITNAILADNNRLELVELLNACSVVLQTWSMTIFEAIMMNRPVISISPFKKDYGSFVPVIKEGGAIEVQNLIDLKKWLLIFTNSNQSKTKEQLQKAKQACARFISNPKGKVGEKVIQLLFS